MQSWSTLFGTKFFDHFVFRKIKKCISTLNQNVFFQKAAFKSSRVCGTRWCLSNVREYSTLCSEAAESCLPTTWDSEKQFRFGKNSLIIYWLHHTSDYLNEPFNFDCLKIGKNCFHRSSKRTIIIIYKACVIGFLFSFQWHLIFACYFKMSLLIKKTSSNRFKVWNDKLTKHRVLPFLKITAAHVLNLKSKIKKYKQLHVTDLPLFQGE